MTFTWKVNVPAPPAEMEDMVHVTALAVESYVPGELALPVT